VPKEAGRSVLVVDDDCAITKMLSHNLGNGKIQIMTAANGYECVKILHQTNVDLILLDIRLPDFSGWGILSLLRLTEATCHIPTIIISVEPPDMALIDRFKPDDYIQKPFDMRDLLVRVERIMGSRMPGFNR
jgi:DNA-binding response OmpR family regulator